MPLPPAHFLIGAVAAELTGRTRKVDETRPAGEAADSPPSGAAASFPAAGMLSGILAGRSWRDRRVWGLWLLGGMLALLPDMDTGFGILLGRGNEFHGVFTHSLVAVAVVAGAAWLLAGRRRNRRRWAAVAAAAYGSHLLLDLLQKRDQTSVAPLWPVSSETLGTLVPIFPSVRYVRGAGPDGAALSLFHPTVFPWLLAQTLVALLVVALLIGGRELWRRRGIRRRAGEGDAGGEIRGRPREGERSDSEAGRRAG